MIRIVNIDCTCGFRDRVTHDCPHDLVQRPSGPTLYLDPDPFGEPVIWHDDALGVPQPVIAKSDLVVGSRWLWDEIVARLTGAG